MVERLGTVLLLAMLFWVAVAAYFVGLLVLLTPLHGLLAPSSPKRARVARSGGPLRMLICVPATVYRLSQNGTVAFGPVNSAHLTFAAVAVLFVLGGFGFASSFRTSSAKPINADTDRKATNRTHKWAIGGALAIAAVVPPVLWVLGAFF